jgi:putative inorganic carbon (HCO3(-)) transporter
MIYRLGLFFGIVLLGLCLLFTFSRGGWLGFLAGGLLMLFLSHRWKVILPAICVFILVLILAPGVRERAAFTFQAGGDASRFAIWQGAWAMIRENPFLGKGMGTFMQYFPHYTKDLGVQYAHNCYLQMWAEIGVFGLLSFLLFVGSILYRGIRIFRKESPFVLLGLICAIFGFLAHSFFDTQLYSLQLCVLFWFLLGMVARYGYPTT